MGIILLKDFFFTITCVFSREELTLMAYPLLFNAGVGAFGSFVSFTILGGVNCTASIVGGIGACGGAGGTGGGGGGLGFVV